MQRRETIEEFAIRAGVTEENVREAIKHQYLVCEMVEGNPRVVLNLFAQLYCKAVRQGQDISSLPKWKGTRGKLRKRIHGIGIYVSPYTVYALRPDGIPLEFDSIGDAEQYCLSTTEFIKHNSRTRAQTRRTKPCYLALHEIEYLLSILPAINKNTLLRNKLSKAAYGTKLAMELHH